MQKNKRRLLILTGQVIAEHYNKVQQKLLAHAELLTIQIADAMSPKLTMDQRQQLILYTTLEPCMMCFGAARNFNIGRLCYALESPGDGISPIVYQWERGSAHRPHHRVYAVPEMTAGVCRAESARLFSVFADRYPDVITARWARHLAALAHKPQPETHYRTWSRRED